MSTFGDIVAANWSSQEAAFAEDVIYTDSTGTRHSVKGIPSPDVAKGLVVPGVSEETQHKMQMTFLEGAIPIITNRVDFIDYKGMRFRVMWHTPGDGQVVLDLEFKDTTMLAARGRAS